MAERPPVACIMPTYNRREFVPQAVKYFREQDYRNRELIIVDDGGDPVAGLLPDDPQIKYIRLERRITVGAKRNLAIEHSAADIILHWDDDDWQARHRIRYQVEHLLREDAEVCGLNKLLFFDLRTRQCWLYEYLQRSKTWLAGGALCYRKSFWQNNRFANVNIGEDTRFVWRNAIRNVCVLPDFTFYIAMIHPKNTSPKSLSHPYWKKWHHIDFQSLVKEDYTFYAGFHK